MSKHPAPSTTNPNIAKHSAKENIGIISSVGVEKLIKKILSGQQKNCQIFISGLTPPIDLSGWIVASQYDLQTARGSFLIKRESDYVLTYVSQGTTALAIQVSAGYFEAELAQHIIQGKMEVHSPESLSRPKPATIGSDSADDL